MDNRKILFKQSQSPGDILVATAVIAAVKETYPEWEIDLRSACPEITEHNPRITFLDEKDKSVEIITLENNIYINKSGTSGMHYAEGFIREAEDKLGLPLKRFDEKGQGIWPELYIAEKEKTWINQVATEFGYNGRFWLINAGYKPECRLKWYPFYQEVVNLLKDKITFVQIGHKDHQHPELKNALNLVGKTDLRQLIRLAYWADGIVSGISFPMHMAAALRKPCVVLAGGKEPIRWEMYGTHRYLYNGGALRCAGLHGCWRPKLTDCINLVGGNVPRCFAMIKPETVAQSILDYYEGGALQF